MMKKLIAMTLVLCFIGGLTAIADTQWVDYHCDEEQFSTKIPVSGSTGYLDQRGLVIYGAVL